MTGIEPTDELLSAYLDGEVTPDERAAVDAALTGSSERRDALAALAGARDAVRDLGDPPVPAGFLAGLEQAVASQLAAADLASATRDSATARRPRRGLAWLAGGVAAAALLAAFVVPATDRVDPAVPRRVDTHVARASLGEDPVSELAPIAVAAGGVRR